MTLPGTVPAPRIVLVTLRRDAITCESVQAERQRCQLLTDSRIVELPPESIAAYLDAPRDVVRARSNAVALALRHYPDASHVLWWDSDVVLPSLAVVSRLLASGHDLVGCPVPRKRIERWGDEREASDFCYRVTGPDGTTVRRQPDAHGCIDVDALPFGLMLTSAHALRAMVAHYRDELWYTDGGFEAVALFALWFETEKRAPGGVRWRQLLSEDFSFCARWRALGGRVHMLLEPCSHAGVHLFTGHVSGLKHVR